MKAVYPPPSRGGMGRGTKAKNSQHFNTGRDQQTNRPMEQRTDTVLESHVRAITMAKKKNKQHVFQYFTPKQ